MIKQNGKKAYYLCLIYLCLNNVRSVKNSPYVPCLLLGSVYFASHGKSTTVAILPFLEICLISKWISHLC